MNEISLEKELYFQENVTHRTVTFTIAHHLPNAYISLDILESFV